MSEIPNGVAVIGEFVGVIEAPYDFLGEDGRRVQGTSYKMGIIVARGVDDFGESTTRRIDIKLSREQAGSLIPRASKLRGAKLLVQVYVNANSGSRGAYLAYAMVKDVEPLMLAAPAKSEAA